MSGAVRTLKQLKKCAPLAANNVKHTALASSTSPANPRVAGAESLPSRKPPKSMSESFQERPKKSATSKASCICNQPDVNKPPKKRCTYYVVVNDDDQDSSNSAHNTCGTY